jgi:predicted transcriptional regulator
METVNYSGLPDWWDEIEDDEKAEIQEGLAQADRSELTPHKEVMSKYQKWLSK